MKRFKFIGNTLLLFFFLCIFSCDKNEDEENIFFVEVLGKGMDCGDTFIVQFKEEDKSKVRKYHENTNSFYPVYYANNLIEDHKVAGLKLRITLEVCDAIEFPLCTAWGPGYGHVCIKTSELVLSD